MSKEFKTPDKLKLDSSSPTPDTVKHLKQESIFSNSGSKAHASPISENRYKSQDSGNADKKIDQDEIEDSDSYKSSKLLTYSIEHSKVHHERRQKTIAELDDILQVLKESEKIKKNEGKNINQQIIEPKNISHIRNISDTDSVVYIGSDDERHLHDFKFQPFVLGEIQNRESLLVLDNTPCTAYCRYCKIDVHTSVEFYNTKLSKGVMKVVASIFSCCTLPTWINTLRVHKCPYCSLVIAKCR